jgi:hypothetical protein
MGNKSFRNRFGRFLWLYLLTSGLSAYIGVPLSISFTENLFAFIGMLLLINSPLFIVGMILYNKSLEADKQNGISITPFRNLLLPWPKAAIVLAIFAFFEFLVAVPLMAFQLYPCSDIDLFRKINGCVSYIPHHSLIQNIVFSKDGKIFATAEFGGPVQIWSYPDLTLLKNLGNDWLFRPKISLSSNGEELAICNEGPISVLKTRTGEVLHTLIPDNDESCDVVFTPDDKSIISISKYGLQTWDVFTGRLISSIPQDEKDYLAITSNGKYLALGSSRGSMNIKIWDIANNQVITTIQRPDLLTSMAFSRDGKYLLTASLDVESFKAESNMNISVVNVWNIKSGELEHTITLQNFSAKNISSSRNSNLFVVGTESCQLFRNPLFEKPCAYFGQIASNEALTGLKIPFSADSVAFSPTDDRILIGVFKNVYIWQVK